MTRHSHIAVCIIYPTDPLGVSPGGIDPFIRGILRWAPEDIQFSLAGITSDVTKRPLRKWQQCSVGGNPFQFYPVTSVQNSGRQSAVPLTLRYMAALAWRRRQIVADVLEFHRIEPCFLFLSSGRPMSLTMHQNMQDLKNRGSDIRWRHFPALYYSLERLAMRHMRSMFCVREDAVKDYRKKFPQLAPFIKFTPTWPDTEIFSPVDNAERDRLREDAAEKYGFSPKRRILISVGRLDRQKNPLLMIDALKIVCQRDRELQLLVVGDGVLRSSILRRIDTLGLADNVTLCGVQPAPEIANLLRIADTFVLSSDYEGMPICVLEALACGLPVASTDVGEVSRVVKSDTNGQLAKSHDTADFADAVARCLDAAARLRGRSCLDAVGPFSPPAVLEPLYDNYRRLVSKQEP